MSYKINVTMDFGKMSIEKETRAEILNEYNKIKSYFSDVTCDIEVWNGDEIMFTKKCNKEHSFETLYKRLISILIEMSELEQSLLKDVTKYGNKKNKFYHKLEETDICDMSMDMLLDFKYNLTKRRLIEDETRRFYAFHNTLLEMKRLLQRYYDTRIHNENLSWWHLNNEDFFREDSCKKKGNTNFLKSIKEYRY